MQDLSRDLLAFLAVQAQDPDAIRRVLDAYTVRELGILANDARELASWCELVRGQKREASFIPPRATDWT